MLSSLPTTRQHYADDNDELPFLFRIPEILTRHHLADDALSYVTSQW